MEKNSNGVWVGREDSVQSWEGTKTHHHYYGT